MGATSAEIIIIIGIILVTASSGLFVAKELVETRDVAQHVADESIVRSVGNGVDILTIHGKGNQPRTFEYVYVMVKLKQKSASLVLDDILLHITSGDFDSYYSYDVLIDCDLDPFLSSDMVSLSHERNALHYGVAFRKNAQSQSRHVIDEDDILIFCARLPSLVGDAKQMFVSVVPDSAMPAKASFKTPDVLRGSYFQIYPPTGSVY